MFEKDTQVMPKLAAALVLVVSLSLVGLLATTGHAATEANRPTQSPGPALGVKVEQGFMSVNVREMSLIDVLRAVGEQAAIRVTIQKGSTDPVTQSFAGLSLDEGIRRLAQGYSVVLIYAATGDRAEGGRLAEVRVYKDSTDPGTAEVLTFALPSRGRGLDSHTDG